jgi:quercetin dioxygenase-like cupin family protein
VSIVRGYALEAMVGDPDDHRPSSRWAIVTDPGGDDGRVDGLAVIVEEIGPGDRIPLHIHRVDEVILPRGRGRFRLGGETQDVEDGSVVFVPAGVAHGFHNDGAAPLPLQAVFPTTRIWLRYLERNPAPGTGDQRIGAAGTFDVRAGTFQPDEP